MQIPCCALTAKKPGAGEHHPAFIHPCVRPNYATNLGTRATLRHYHLEGDEVNAHSVTVRDEGKDDRRVFLSLAAKTSRARLTYCGPSASIDVRTSSLIRD